MLERYSLFLTSAVNLVGLIASLWLGLYILTRSPGSRTSWLGTGTLWALSGFFLSSLTQIHGPPGEAPPRWWWGWSVGIAVPVWFHLSASLLPDKLARRERPLVVVVYLLALSFVMMEAFLPWVFAGKALRPHLYHSGERPGPLYPVFGLYLFLVPVFSLCNLRLSWKRAKSLAIRRRLAILLWAALLAVLSAAYGVISTCLRLDAPALVSSLGLGAAVVLLGYGVVCYNALVQGRAIRRDFIHTALAMALTVGAYLVAALISHLVFGVPFIAFIFILMLAVVSHALYDWGRTYLDQLLYRQQFSRLRASLKDLARTPISHQDIKGHFQDILENLGQSLQARRAFIALKEEEGFAIIANRHVDIEGGFVISDVLDTDESTVLSPPAAALGLGDTAVIVPLHAAGEQVGVIALGERGIEVGYSEDDLVLVEDLADRLAGVVYTVRLQERSIERINVLLGAVREREQEMRGVMREALSAPGLEGESEGYAVSLVEDALRHLYDYAYLGEHRLSQLGIVGSHLDVGEEACVTHLDRGRGLHRVLMVGIEKLRPPGSPLSLPTREWHQYVILRDCYIMGKPNREVMSVLYISEGTFNRARRRAVRAVAKSLLEMEGRGRVS